jgi:hypothetical protein
VSELTAEALASDLRVQAREEVLTEAREAWADFVEKAAKVVDPFAPTGAQLEVTLAVLRMNRALGIVGPVVFGGRIPKKQKEH